MDLRLIVIHPLSIRRGHLPSILTHLTKSGLKILATDTYPVCLSTMRALTRSRSEEKDHEEFIQSFAQTPATVLLLASSTDGVIDDVLGSTDTPQRNSLREKFRGSNWLANPRPYDTVFTSFDPAYNTMVFSMFFSSHRGWGSLSQYI